MQCSHSAVEMLRDRLWSAEQTRRVIRRPDDDFVVPHEVAAYAVQDAVFELRASPLLGFKLGGTVRPLPGEDRRSYGTLSMWHCTGQDGGSVDVGRFTQPCVEPEIALRLGRELAGEGHDRASVAAHLDAVLPALEIADTRYAAFPASLLDNIADNSSSGAVVFGEPMAWRSGRDLRVETVRFLVDGNCEGEGCGADVMGDPLAALGWLAGRLAQNGRVLPAGAIVITGGITPSSVASSGRVFRAEFSSIGHVELRFS